MFSGKLGSFVLDRFFLENAFWDDDSTFEYNLRFGANGISTELSNLLKDWRGIGGYTIEYYIYPTGLATDTIPNFNEIAGAGNFRIQPLSTARSWSFGLTRSVGETDYKIGFNYLVTEPATRRIQTAANSISPGQWYRLALVIQPDGNDRIVSIYLDGVRQDIQLDGGAFSNTITLNEAELANVNIGGTSSWMSLGGTSQVGPGTTIRGYVDEFRISNNVRYSGASYNVSDFPFSNDGNTIALFHFDGIGGSINFTDSSQFNWNIINNNNSVIISDTKRNLGP